MNEDRTSKLYAGHMGICAVLANVLIDKGIITQSELREHFEQAHEAARQCSGGTDVAVVLEDMLRYLEPARNRAQSFMIEATGKTTNASAYWSSSLLAFGAA